MKKLTVIFVMVCFLASGAVVYAGQFGPPEPAVKRGQLSLGIGYFSYADKLEPRGTLTWDEHVFKQDQVYAQLDYGCMKNWEIYLRIGEAGMKVKEAFEYEIPQDFKDSGKLFSTLGVKGIFNIGPKFGVGPFLQASLFSKYEDKKVGEVEDIPVPVPAILRYKYPWEVDFGIGFQAKISNIVFYGGPFAYWNRVKTELEASFPSGIKTRSLTYREKNNFGGFAGLRLSLSKKFNLEIEGQIKREISAGASISYLF